MLLQTGSSEPMRLELKLHQVATKTTITTIITTAATLVFSLSCTGLMGTSVAELANAVVCTRLLKAEAPEQRLCPVIAPSFLLIDFCRLFDQM